MKSFGVFAALCIFAAIYLVPAQASARPGDLSDQFGDGGVVETPVSVGQNQSPSEILATQDGKTIVSGVDTAKGRSLLRQFLPDGSLDTGFGNGGTVTSAGSGWDSIALASKGKIVVAGSRGNLGEITRLNSDGSVDGTFGIDGSFIFDAEPLKIPYYASSPIDIDLFSLKILDDGRIRAIGNFFDCEYGCDNLLEVGLLADGSPDPEFSGAGGFVVLPFLDGRISWAWIDSGGRARVVRGQNQEGEYGIDVGFISTTVTSSGLVDQTNVNRFSVPFVGVVRETSSHAITVDASGNLLLGVKNQIIKVTSDGYEPVVPNVTPRIAQWDLTRFLPWRSPTFEINDLETDDEGRLLVSGGLARGCCDGSDMSGFIARFTSTGRPDATFSGDGISIAWLGEPKAGYDRPPSTTTLTQAADSIVIAGKGFRGPGNGFNLAKMESGSAEWLRCGGKLADYIGDERADVIEDEAGTFVTLGGNDRVSNASFSTVCSGAGDDKVGTVYGPSEFFGGPGNDRLNGSRTSDIIHGGPGKDLIRGGRQDDLLTGGPGPDLLVGGSWDDRIVGGPGRDVLRGGSGRDQLFGGPGTDSISVGRPGPLISIYEGTLSGVRTRFTRIGDRLGRTRVWMELNCLGNDTKDMNLSSAGFDFDPSSGRFANIGPPYDPEDDLNFIANFKGRLGNRSADGKLSIVDSDHFSDNYTCYSGKSLENPWVKFKAKLEPQKKQFARQ